METMPEANLKHYIKNTERFKWFGVSNIQRTCKISYSQAKNVELLGIAKGMIRLDDDSGKLHKRIC